MDTVLILLTTYNGQRFIGEMIDSLLVQDHKSIHIVISDDCSTDDTPQIVSDYASRFPDMITFYQSNLKFGNAQAHFLHLLEQFHDADYIMFCDQDDVWHPDKVSRTLQFVKQAEPDTPCPILAHTDLHVVDEHLEQIHPSFCRYSNIDGTRIAFNQLLVHNVVTGCTVMLNRELANLATSRTFDKKSVIMHDWWLAILAAACGRVVFLNEPTIEYRQHNSNTVGAQNVRSLSFLWSWITARKMKKSMTLCLQQARSLYEAYQDFLPADAKETLAAFLSTEKKNIFARNYIYAKYKLYKYGFTRRMAQALGL